MKKNSLPKRATKPELPQGWTERKIRELLDYYENQTEEEQVAEHEGAYAAAGQTMMGVPTELVPEVRKLISRRQGV